MKMEKGGDRELRKKKGNLKLGWGHANKSSKAQKNELGRNELVTLRLKVHFFYQLSQQNTYCYFFFLNI